jgi:hypothetical protein
MMAIAHRFGAPPEDAAMLYRWVEPLTLLIATRREKATEAMRRWSWRLVPEWTSP